MQTVNDLLTMYVGAASQHALRTTFVPFEEAVSFDREIVAYWSQLAGRDVSSPLFHLPLRMGGLGVGSAVHRHAAAPWTAWHSIIPTLQEATGAPDIDSLFTPTPILRGQLHQLQVMLSEQHGHSFTSAQIIGSCPPYKWFPKNTGQHDTTNGTSTAQQRSLRGRRQVLPSFACQTTHATSPSLEPPSQHFSHMPRRQCCQTRMRLHHR